MKQPLPHSPGETFVRAGTLEAFDDFEAWLLEFCNRHDLPPRLTADLRLCLHELVANIVIHGATSVPRIEASLSNASGHVTLKLNDNAAPFNPVAAHAGPLTGALEDAPIGGLGLHLVQQYADVLSYCRYDGINRLTLIRGPRGKERDDVV